MTWWEGLMRYLNDTGESVEPPELLEPQHTPARTDAFERDAVLVRGMAEKDAPLLPLQKQVPFLHKPDLPATAPRSCAGGLGLPRGRAAWWVQPVEVVDGDGVGTGYWRMAAMLTQSVRTEMGLRRGPFRLCIHNHTSPESAAACYEARDNQLTAVGPEGGYVEGIRAWSATLLGKPGTHAPTPLLPVGAEVSVGVVGVDAAEPPG